MFSNRTPSYILFMFLNSPSHRLMGKLITNVDGMVAGIEKHLAPIIKERLEQERIHGPNWIDRPVSRHSYSLVSTMSSFLFRSIERSHHLDARRSQSIERRTHCPKYGQAGDRIQLRVYLFFSCCELLSRTWLFLSTRDMNVTFLGHF